MKKLIALFIILCTYTAFADSFVRQYSYLTACPYENGNYMDNCATSTEMPNGVVVVFNYNHTNNIYLALSDTGKILYYVNLKSALVNDSGDSVKSYNFIDNEGIPIEVIWNGNWLRFVYDEVVLIEYSNEKFIRNEDD